jgi:hypothetical protein
MNTRNKIFVALAATMVIAAPLALAGHEGYGPTARDVVTGHTVFVDDRGFDENIAAIAGITERKVVWFNGATIFDTTTRGFVIAVEADSSEFPDLWSCDPRDGIDFEFVDQDMTFVDPNGQHHVVTHYTYRCQGTPPAPLSDLADGTALEEGLEGTPLQFRNHAWVTYNHQKIDDPTVMDEYNFALAVDTREFNRLLDQDDRTRNRNPPCDHTNPNFCHDGTGGDNTDEIKDGNSKNPDTGLHTPDNPNSTYNREHGHNVAEVDLTFKRSDPGAGQSTGCADENNPATAVNETAAGDRCREALGCGGTPPYDPDPTTPQFETFPPDSPPCTDTADTAP